MSTPRFFAAAAGVAVIVVSALAVAGASNTTAAATPWCTIDSLSLSTDPLPVPPPADPSSQSQITLVLTNKSMQSCTLQGYPRVELTGSADPVFGPTYQLPRQAADAQLVTLVPGDSASSILTFLPGPPDGWVPDTIVVTPPHTSTPLNTPWIVPGTTVLRQDAATHPGTYVGPVQPSH